MVASLFYNSKGFSIYLVFFRLSNITSLLIKCISWMVIIDCENHTTVPCCSYLYFLCVFFLWYVLHMSFNNLLAVTLYLEAWRIPNIWLKTSFNCCPISLAILYCSKKSIAFYLFKAFFPNHSVCQKLTRIWQHDQNCWMGIQIDNLSLI